jgi:hypothetical protein
MKCIAFEITVSVQIKTNTSLNWQSAKISNLTNNYQEANNFSYYIELQIRQVIVVELYFYIHKVMNISAKFLHLNSCT